MHVGSEVSPAQDQRLRLALQAGGFGTWVWDKASGVTTWDAELEGVFGLPPGGFDGTYEAWLSKLHPDDRPDVLRHIEDAMARRGTYEIRHRILWPDGSVHWIDGLGQITIDDDGEPTGSIGCTRDVTAQVMVEEQLAAVAMDARRDALRAELLQSVTASLAGAMSVDEVAGILRMQVEGLLGADGAAVSLIDRSGTTLGIVSSFGFDQELTDTYVTIPMRASTPMTDAARFGRAVVVQASEVSDRYPALAAVSAGTGHTLLCAMPLQVPGRALGALLLTFTGRTSFEPDELLFVESVAGQCSLALDRARLVDRLGEVALTMQDGLALQDLPRIAGFEVAAVYRPGGDEMEHLGGDWYDALELPDGLVALVIGDVMGRGVASAASMVRVRTAARAYVWVDPTPEVVLRKLDAFVQREAPDDFITLVYATLQRQTGALRIINAGHLPPLLWEAEASARFLRSQPGLPLGLTEVARTADDATVYPGAAMMLFTDGLVERPDEDIDGSLKRLQDAVWAEHMDGPLQSMLDRVVGVMTAGQDRGDDVTALVIRRDVVGEEAGG